MLFSRIVDPPNLLRTEIARTAIGIDALTVSPARSPRYTVEAPKSRPKAMPSPIAFAVNSAGDCVGGTYGDHSAMARDGSIGACESAEQASPGARPGVRADHQ